MVLLCCISEVFLVVHLCFFFSLSKYRLVKDNWEWLSALIVIVVGRMNHMTELIFIADLIDIEVL